MLDRAVAHQSHVSVHLSPTLASTYESLGDKMFHIKLTHGPLASSLCLCLSVSLSHCLTVSLSLCLTVSLSLCLSVSLSLCLSVSLSLCLSVSLSLSVSVSVSVASYGRTRSGPPQCNDTLQPQSAWQAVIPTLMAATDSPDTDSLFAATPPRRSQLLPRPPNEHTLPAPQATRCSPTHPRHAEKTLANDIQRTLR